MWARSPRVYLGHWIHGERILQNETVGRTFWIFAQAVVKDIFEGLRLQQECSKILQGCSFFREPWIIGTNLMRSGTHLQETHQIPGSNETL